MVYEFFGFLTWSGERRADDLLPGPEILEARHNSAAEEPGGAGDDHRGRAGHRDGELSL